MLFDVRKRGAATRGLGSSTTGPGIVLLAVALLTFVLACSNDSPGTYQGYIEGDYLYISSPAGGKVVAVSVEKGDEVKSGDALYSLDPEPELTALREAESRLSAAEALHEDKTVGQRPTELAAIEAAIAQAEASLAYSEKEYLRIKSLHEQEVVAAERLDSAQAAYERDKAAVSELGERLKTARLGARAGQVQAASKEVQGAEAALERVRWTLEQKKGVAPGDSRVVDVLYHEGEYVPASYPVVVLLPPERVKARYFVPEPALAAIKTGQRVEVSIDGLASPLQATISYIAPKAEYTPPFIYSRESREKLVFMVEAVFSPDVAGRLNPGQPIEVRAAR